MAHLKNLVVNGNSRTIGTVYASDYVGKVNGYINDTYTKNTGDTWVPVLKGKTVQHREIPLAYNNDPSTLSVKYATTAGSANSVAWNNVSGKPATYSPSTHTHTIAQVTNLQSSLDAKADLSYLNKNFYSTTSVDNIFNSLNYKEIHIDGDNTDNYPYHRILSIQNVSALWKDLTGIYLIDQKFDNGSYGIVKVTLRTNDKVSNYSVSIRWLVRSASVAPTDISYGAYLHDGKLDVDVFMRRIGGWPRTHMYNMFGLTGWTMINSREATNTTKTDRLTSVECYSSLADAGTKIHSATYSRTGEGIDEGSVFNATEFDGHSSSEYYLKTQTISLGDATDLPSSYTGGNIFKNP
jgi:hypothetical protein